MPGVTQQSAKHPEYPVSLYRISTYCQVAGEYLSESGTKPSWHGLLSIFLLQVQCMPVRNYVHLKSWEECRMINDPIVEEVRRYRKEHAARYGNDLNRIVEALKKRERESHRIRLNPGPKLLIKNKSKYSCESVPPVP